MITTRFYLDCRRVESGMVAPLRVVLTKNGVRALVNIGFSILPSQWDAKRQIIIGHPCKHQFNSLIMERKLAVDNILYRLETSGELAGLKAGEIKSMVEAELFPDRVPRVTFIARYDAFAKDKSEGTRRIYRMTRKRLEDFAGEELGTLTFEQMDVAWLKRFDAFLARTSPARNARNIHFRNIRAVFNDALSDEVITCYPFRKFKLTPEPTRKRALTAQKLRAVFDAQVMPHEERYRDCFKLSFLLCGINAVDLCRLGKDAVVNGRVEYRRAKTHRLYSIKLEPEAQELIDKYAGKDWLLNYHDGCKSYRSFYMRADKCISKIGKSLGCVGLTSYWARHSWATIASSLDIPKETIAAALGHGGNTVTDIYIDFDQAKVDRANRKVIDYVLHGDQESNGI